MEQAGLKVYSLFVSIHVPSAMVSIPGGTFRQGDVEELGESWRNPVREVMIQPFAMGKHEVTFEEYDRFAIATNRPLPNDQE
jgi:formylglycine-generating enzyme required for sulfatase activity